MRAFDAARRHIWLTYKVKLSFWFTLPWVLLGLGHATVEVAVQCGLRALDLFNILPNDHPHHWVTMLLCMPGSMGRQQLELFMSRARGLCELPLLHRMAARFKFVIIAERWVESLHAHLKTSLQGAPHHGVCHVASMACLESLEEALSVDPHCLKMFVNHRLAVRNPRAGWEAWVSSSTTRCSL